MAHEEAQQVGGPQAQHGVLALAQAQQLHLRGAGSREAGGAKSGPGGWRVGDRWMTGVQVLSVGHQEKTKNATQPPHSKTQPPKAAHQRGAHVAIDHFLHHAHVAAQRVAVHQGGQLGVRVGCEGRGRG